MDKKINDFYCISELMLEVISYFIQFKNEILTDRLSDATFYNRIITIYKVIKPFLDNKMSIFEEYGAFKI